MFCAGENHDNTQEICSLFLLEKEHMKAGMYVILLENAPLNVVT